MSFARQSRAALDAMPSSLFLNTAMTGGARASIASGSKHREARLRRAGVDSRFSGGPVGGCPQPPALS
jgi:hypothetical protein